MGSEPVRKPLTADQHRELFANQDDCLIHMSEGKKPPLKALVSLPPWRAVLIARIAGEAGWMSKEEVEGFVEEARKAPADAIVLRKV